jgi:hypothetical protein
MRLIMYRVLVADAFSLIAAAQALPGVQVFAPKTRGMLVECDDAITDDQLAALDAVVQAQATVVADPVGPGQGSSVAPGDDRTGMLTLS